MDALLHAAGFAKRGRAWYDTRMLVAPTSLRVLGDPVLHEVTHTVERFDTYLQDLVVRMHYTLMSAGGVGLAAPQIGVLSRVLVLRVPGSAVTTEAGIAADDQMGPPEMMANPLWQPVGEDADVDIEGCLSVPDLVIPVWRYSNIEVQWQAIGGEPREGRFSGLAARVIQHECDHLDGRLHLDHLGARARAKAVYQWHQDHPRDTNPDAPHPITRVV